MQQRSGSDLSYAGSSIPAPRSGLQRTVSSAAASGKAGSEKGRLGAYASAAADEPASKLMRSVSGTAVLPCDTAQLQQQPSSTEDLRRSVESTGLKVHAARSAAVGALQRGIDLHHNPVRAFVKELPGKSYYCHLLRKGEAGVQAVNLSSLCRYSRKKSASQTSNSPQPIAHAAGWRKWRSPSAVLKCV